MKLADRKVYSIAATLVVALIVGIYSMTHRGNGLVYPKPPQIGLGPPVLAADLKRISANPPTATFAFDPEAQPYHFYQRASCTVRLTIPDSMPLPSDASLALRSKGADYVHQPMELVGQEGKTMVLQVKFRAPNVPGNFRVELEVSYTTSDAQPGSKRFKFDLPGPTLKVIR